MKERKKSCFKCKHFNREGVKTCNSCMKWNDKIGKVEMNNFEGV